MMESPNPEARAALERAYALLGEHTPLRHDCGVRCGGACCACDDDGQGGVYLFPGERAEDMPWGEVVATEFAPMLICDGACEREKRPLACRFFPLTPVIGRDGGWTVRMDARAKTVCPLAQGSLKALDADFRAMAKQAVRALSECGEQEAFLRKWADAEAEYREGLKTLLGML